MALPVPANTTCDIYRAGNAPPAAPDVAGVSAVLVPAFEQGRETGEGEAAQFRFTHTLSVDLATDLRDDFSAWTGAAANRDRVYIPDQDGVAYHVNVVERINRGSALEMKKAYLDRKLPAWPWPNRPVVGRLLGHWKFDEGSGTIARDSSGNNNHGTVLGNVGWDADVPSVAFADPSSFSFDGATAIQVGNLDTAGFTAACWIRRANSNDENCFVILGDLGSWGMGIVQSAVTGDLDGNLDSFKAFLCRNGADHVRSFGTVSDTAWHHLAISHDGATVRIYLDGVLDRSRSYPRTFASAGAPYQFGLNAAAKVDDIRVYNVVLTATEIAQLAAGINVL